MRKIIWIAIFLGFATSLFAEGQATPSASASVVSRQPYHIKIYAVDRDVTAPELLPLSPFPPFTGDCQDKLDGSVKLSIIVDPAGKPRKVKFLQPLRNDLDRLVIPLVYADRFKPGTREGAPVAVLRSVDVKMQACTTEEKNETGKKMSWLRLRAQPEQMFDSLPQPPEDSAYLSLADMSKDYGGEASPVLRIATNVTAPVPLNAVEAKFSEEARKANFEGICTVEATIDTNGIPQDIRVVHPLGMGLDEKAVEAASKYRFTPAMHNGQPVPVKISIEINFRLN
jgi:TonB family protein